MANETAVNTSAQGAAVNTETLEQRLARLQKSYDTLVSIGDMELADAAAKKITAVKREMADAGLKGLREQLRSGFDKFGANTAAAIKQALGDAFDEVEVTFTIKADGTVAHNLKRRTAAAEGTTRTGGGRGKKRQYNGVIYADANKALEAWAKDTGHKLPESAFSAPREIKRLKLEEVIVEVADETAAS